MNSYLPIDAYEEDVCEEMNQLAYAKERLTYMSFLQYIANNINILCTEYCELTNKYKNKDNKESYLIEVPISYNEGKRDIP